MKIYNMANIPSGFTPEVDYDKIWQSGYTAGYASGYTDAIGTCEDIFFKKYFTIKTNYNGIIQLGSPWIYRVNKGEWIEATGIIEVHFGDEIEIKGEGNPSYMFMFDRKITSPVIVYGNIMSLFYGDDFKNKTRFPNESVNCNSMFMECTGLIDASQLKLPATILNNNAYADMFRDCINLEYGPELPATTLAEDCYESMFMNCQNLNYAPTLPATTLSNMCYYGMFASCFKLKTAPELPAKILTPNCYEYMFDRCSSLNQITCLAEDISANNCTFAWTNLVGNTGTFITPRSTDWQIGHYGIPEGWTRVDAE